MSVSTSRKPASDGIRVALLTPVFWPEVRRGTERLVRELADGLIARGHRPTVITSHRGPPRRTVEDGLPVVRVPRPPTRALRRLLLEDHLAHVPFAYAALRRGDYDLAHAVYVGDALAAARWSRRTGRPAIFSYMGIPDPDGLAERRLRLSLTRRACAGCTVVALSRLAADAFRTSLGVDAHVIHPGVDLEAFVPGPRAEQPTIFCAAPPEVPRKRVELLVAAFARVRRERPDARLRLLRPSDARMAARLEAEPGVSIAEMVGDAGLAPEYAGAWVSALPSLSEAFGLVAVESLACGTPVVGTDHGAIPEVIDRPEVGRLFSGGEDELAGALLEAIDQAPDPGGAEACRRRAADFSTDTATERYVALYRELLGR